MIDTHCHLDEHLYKDVEQVIKHMGENIMIAAGVDTKSSMHVLELIKDNPAIYGVIGFHPEEIETAALLFPLPALKYPLLQHIHKQPHRRLLLGDVL